MYDFIQEELWGTAAQCDKDVWGLCQKTTVLTLPINFIYQACVKHFKGID